MVFGRSEEEPYSLGDLDTTEGGVGEVEEDSQHHRDGNQPQTFVGQGSQHWREGREGCDKLISVNQSNQLISLNQKNQLNDNQNNQLVSLS